MLVTKRHRLAVAAVVWVLLTAGSALAQKAEPLRIQFKRGASSATVSGRLQGRQQMEYVLGAKQNQSLTLNMDAAPTGTLRVMVRDPKGTELPLRAVSNTSWSASLPDNGDYDVWVVRVAGTPGRSTFRLRVSIR